MKYEIHLGFRDSQIISLCWTCPSNSDIKLSSIYLSPSLAIYLSSLISLSIFLSFSLSKSFLLCWTCVIPRNLIWRKEFCPIWFWNSLTWHFHSSSNSQGFLKLSLLTLSAQAYRLLCVAREDSINNSATGRARRLDSKVHPSKTYYNIKKL